MDIHAPDRGDLTETAPRGAFLIPRPLAVDAYSQMRTRKAGSMSTPPTLHPVASSDGEGSERTFPQGLGGVQQGTSCGMLGSELSASLEVDAPVNVWRGVKRCPMVGASAKCEYTDRIHIILCVE